MKKSLLMLMLSAAVAVGGDWIFSTRDATLQGQGPRKFTVYPLSPGIRGTNVIAGDQLRAQTDRSGDVVVTNLVGGDYRTELAGPFKVTTNWYRLPETNGVQSATPFCTGPTNGAPSVLAYSRGQVDGLLQGMFTSNNLTAGSNVTFRASGGKTYVDSSAYFDGLRSKFYTGDTLGYEWDGGIKLQYGGYHLWIDSDMGGFAFDNGGSYFDFVVRSPGVIWGNGRGLTNIPPQAIAGPPWAATNSFPVVFHTGNGDYMAMRDGVTGGDGIQFENSFGMWEFLGAFAVSSELSAPKVISSAFGFPNCHVTIEQDDNDTLLLGNTAEAASNLSVSGDVIASEFIGGIQGSRVLNPPWQYGSSALTNLSTAYTNTSIIVASNIVATGTVTSSNVVAIGGVSMNFPIVLSSVEIAGSGWYSHSIGPYECPAIRATTTGGYTDYNIPIPAWVTNAEIRFEYQFPGSLASVFTNTFAAAYHAPVAGRVWGTTETPTMTISMSGVGMLWKTNRFTWPDTNCPKSIYWRGFPQTNTQAYLYTSRIVVKAKGNFTGDNW